VEIRALPVRLRLGWRGRVFEAFVVDNLVVVANMEAIEVSGGVVAPPQGARGSDPEYTFLAA